MMENKNHIVIRNNVSLKPYNTFGLDYTAEYLVTIRSGDEAVSLFKVKDNSTLRPPLLIIGGGSNILFTSHFRGTVIRAAIKGIKIEEEDNDHVIVSAGAGVEWDKFVEWTVGKGFCGLENLSLIPGNVGAVPVQNIGAYGVEVRDMIVKVITVSISDGSKRIFNNEECRFGYRDSVFKNNEKDKYLITRVYLRLKKSVSLNLEYGSLREEVERLGVPDLLNTRNAVINIRKSKLPDPEVIGNAGSFFRNPVVSRIFAEDLKKEFPGLPVYDDPPDRKKLAAGWLIEQCGWKGKRVGYAGVHDRQSLILVNYGKASGRDIYDLSEKIRESVLKKFGINLEREVEIIGSI